MTLSDSEIAAMDANQRAALIVRLRAGLVDDDRVQQIIRRGNRRRRIALATASIASVLLVPWVVYLAFELPDRHVSQDWTLTWVGFDIGLIVMFALTAFLAWRRRILVVLTAFAAGVMLLVDAWFDTTTSRDLGRLQAVLSAAFIEIPLALFLIGMSWHLLMRVSSTVPRILGGRASVAWHARLGPDVLGEDNS